MSTTPSMYEQFRPGTVRNRAVAWFATHSYRSAAMQGGAFVLGITLVTFLVRQLDDLMPDAAPEPPIALRWFMVDSGVAVVIGALLMCLATAGARALVRLFMRSRTGAR